MRNAFLLAVLLLSLGFLNSVKAEDEKVTITFVVIAPGDTDPAVKLYVAGKLPEESDWKPDAILLKHQDNGEWRGAAKFPKNYSLDYKITGGSWETVEKGEQGEEIDNRNVTADSEKQEKVIVLKWRNMPTTQPSTQPAEKRASTATGDIRKFALHSNVLNNDRNVYVWCPPGYAASDESYPVLYMHDGQNVFDDATSFAGEWRADETAENLIAAKKIPPILIVAIENAGAARIYEYTPTRDPKETAGGGAARYLQFLVSELKPYIDLHFRTKSDAAHTAVCGSSLGGLVSLYTCQEQPEVFGSCGAVSPSLWWDSRSLMMRVAADPSRLKQCRVWIDMGTNEGSTAVESSSNASNARELASFLQKAGMKLGENLQCEIIEGASHNEAAWAKRFGAILQFLFPKAA